MDPMVYDLIIAIATLVIGAVIGIIRERDVNLKFEDKYVKYKLLFDVSGLVIKEMDETLYKEMDEAVAKMKEAFTSTEFTTQMFNEIVKECKDVFDRAQNLLNARK